MTEHEPSGSRPTNSVALCGRISSEPAERSLPSGDTIVTFRVVMDRGRTPMTTRSRQAADWVDCVAWGGRVKRTALRWCRGDVVAIEGALRRRFYRVDAGTSTRVEVEVLAGRIVKRAP